MSFLVRKTILNTCRAIVLRHASTKATAASKSAIEKWDIYAGVLVERLPVITKTLSPIEANFKVSVTSMSCRTIVIPIPRPTFPEYAGSNRV